MKITCVLAGMITIMLCHGACHTSKISNRRKNRLAIKDQSDFKNSIREINRYTHSEWITDSSGQSYELTIFPVDTFKFSIQNGFTGKASKVIVNGSGKQLIRISDTSKFVGSLTSESDVKMTRDLTARTGNRATSVKRRGGIWLGIFVGLIAGLIVLWIWRKFKKHTSL